MRWVKIKRKIYFFAINHDYIKLFVISYVAFSAIIAIFFGLFYFLLWILAHLVLEIYKRYHMFGKLDLEDFLIALQHCRVDLMFFFVGIAIEAVSHHAFAIAAGRAGSILEREALVLRELRAVEALKSLPRVLGVAKASKSAAKIAEEIAFRKSPKEKERFYLEKKDYVIIAVIFTSFIFSTIFLLLHNVSFKEVILLYLRAGLSLK